MRTTNGNRDVSLTVACISVVGGTALLSCIWSVLRAGLDCVLVAEPDAVSDEVAELVGEHHLEMIPADGCTVPEKRAIVIRRASTDWVALIEDTCTIDAAWRRGCEELINSELASGGSGPVILGRSLNPSARALYCSDYGKFVLSALRSSGNRHSETMFPYETLPGVNLVYRRETVRSYLTSEGLIESEVNRQMRQAGHGLYIHEHMAVTLQHADADGATLSSRFSHGRLYAGLRSRHMSAGARALRAGACAILPFVLSYRALHSLAHARQQIVATAVHILAFETLWSCGECAGYLLGCGRSLEHWK